MFVKWRLLVVLAAALAACTLLALMYSSLFLSPYPDPEAALAAFYGGEPRPECMQAAPLRQEGRRGVPLVVRELPNKAMPRRRYAIAFLGDGRYEEALPILERLLADTTEIEYFRADALLAIYQIAPVRARELAKQVQNPVGLLQGVVEAIERDDHRLRQMLDHSCG
jgi:HEAT repeat protein